LSLVVKLRFSAPRRRRAPPTTTTTRNKKKTKKVSNKHAPNFRVYQKERWWKRCDELVEFFKALGHSEIAEIKKENKALARWVKRQRFQYRLSTEGKPSSMTKERIHALENVNFVWDSHIGAWEHHFKELEAFQEQHKHCNVPSTYAENPSLAAWVKCQRRQYRQYQAGETTNITMSRIVRLQNMEFRWSFRKQHQQN
jgi:hypothetical protein